MSATCEELFDENEALLADAELMVQHLAEAAECTKELLARAEAAEARVAELEQYIDSNTTERDGVRYSKSVAFEGCAKCKRSGAAAERAALTGRVRNAFIAGFMESGEGWNGEYPFGHPYRSDKARAEDNKALEELADEYLASQDHLQARGVGSDE
jgi:hypothetical protein